MATLNSRPVDGRPDNNKSNTNKVYDTTKSTVSLAKVFGYMALGLLITAAVAFAFGYVFSLLLNKNAEKAFSTLLIVLVASCIVQFILTIVMNFVFLRGKHSILIPYILYTVCMGFMLSTFTIFIDWRILGMAFGITSIAFLAMTLVAVLFRKSNMNGLAVAAMGLFLGAGLLALSTFLFSLWQPGLFQSFYWIIEFAIFGAIMLITIWDLWRINKLSENGAMNKNLSLYCAFNIYVDFLNIFIRVVYYLLIIFSNKK